MRYLFYTRLPIEQFGERRRTPERTCQGSRCSTAGPPEWSELLRFLDLLAVFQWWSWLTAHLHRKPLVGTTIWTAGKLLDCKYAESTRHPWIQHPNDRSAEQPTAWASPLGLPSWPPSSLWFLIWWTLLRFFVSGQRSPNCDYCGRSTSLSEAPMRTRDLKLDNTMYELW